MKNRFIANSIFAATVVALGQGAAYAEDQRYIIKYKNGFGPSVKASLQMSGGKTQQALDVRNMVAANLPADVLAKLQNDPNVEYIEPDPIRYLMAESTPFGIGMVQADQVSDQFVSNRKVCIVDTGYDLGHEDLISSGVTGDDGYGSNDTGNWYNDGHGHGTHVAGTISALGGNNKGVVGVTQNGELQLHIVKVFNDSGSWAYGSDLIAAVDQCVTAGANVISMSLGGSGSSTAEQNAFDQALSNGVLSIAAAGNDGNSSMSYPASYDSVMSVGAVDSSKNIASFSQFNSQVEISAPGVDVNSTLPNNAYAAWSGTSMATPHVSGVAALVWSHHTECNASQIRGALNATSEDRGSAGRDNYYGYGIVQSKAAIDAIAAQGCDVTPPPPPPPVSSELENGVPVTGLSGASGEELNYTFDVPANATDIKFEMSGGTGDADLYVKFGSAPTTSSYDCRPFAYGNNETCNGSSANGTYHVMIRGYSSFSGVSVTASYNEGGGTSPGNELQNGVPVTGLAGSRNDELIYTMPVPAGASNIQFNMSGGSGDADLYVKFGSAPTTNDFDCRPYYSGNNESCTGSNTDGTYYVMVRGYTSFSGVSLTGSYSGGVASINPVVDNFSIEKSMKGNRGIVALDWKDISASQVDIYRNGILKATTYNDGSWTDTLGKKPSGHFTYKVCAQGSSDCSASVTTQF